MRFVFFIFITQIIIILAHFVIYKFGISTYGTLYKHKIFFGSILAILSVSFSLATFFARFSQNTLSSIVYTTSSFWLGFVFWLFIGIVIFSLIGFFTKFDSFYFKLSFLIFFISILILNIVGLFKGYYPKIENVTVGVENLPEEWLNKKALFIADTHYGNLHTEKSAKRLASLIQVINPDVVFVAGDFFDGPMKDFDVFTREFKDIKTTHGIYFVNGNHEDYAGKEKSNKSLLDHGFNIIDQQIVNIDGVQIVGIPYTTSSNSTLDSEATKNSFSANNFDPEKPSIVLKHVPVGIDSILEFRPSFVFFGHTHRGQMWPFTLLVKSIYKEHYYGLIEKNGTIFYTTSGVGGWGPPQRIGTNSEVLLVKFTKSRE